MKFLIWLISHVTKESKFMTDQAITAPAVDTSSTEATAGVKDLSKAYDFIKSGLGHLGEAAEIELIALAKKYL